MAQTTATQVNPWLSMWTHPRETIRWVVQSNPKYGVIWLATFYVLQSLFFFMNFWSFGLTSPLGSLLVLALVSSPLLGFIWVYFYAWILKFTGRWLGGNAPSSHLRAALAWSRLPMIISLAMWFFLLIANPDYVFIQYAGGPSALFVNLILFILEVWTFVLFVQSIREVQHFTLLRSLCNIFIAAIIYSIVFFLAMLIGRFFYII